MSGGLTGCARAFRTGDISEVSIIVNGPSKWSHPKAEAEFTILSLDLLVRFGSSQNEHYNSLVTKKWNISFDGFFTFFERPKNVVKVALLR